MYKCTGQTLWDDCAALPNWENSKVLQCQTKKRPESVLAAFELSFAPCPTSSSITSQFAGDHQSIACFEQPEDHIYDPNSRNITKYSFWITPINIQKSRVANKHANHFCCLIFCIGSFWALRYSSVLELRLGTLGEHSDTFCATKNAAWTILHNMEQPWKSHFLM